MSKAKATAGLAAGIIAVYVVVVSLTVLELVALAAANL